MKKLLVLALLPLNAFALDFSMGIAHVDKDIHSGVGETSNTIGTIKLSEDFKLTDKAKVEVYYQHLSRFSKPEPNDRHNGVNFIGTNLKVKLF